MFNNARDVEANIQSETEMLIELQVVGLVALAMVLGAVIGFERELADKPAGMRTHMFVAGAAALLVALGDVLITRFDADFDSTVIRADPVRIIEAVVTGVAFLGAGTIIRHGTQSNTVEGLTTAASLLFTAAIGVSVALRQYTLAVSATILALVTLRIVHAIATRLMHLKTKSAKEK